MRCPLCGIVMVWERFYGSDENFVDGDASKCGEIIDEVILENRQAGISRIVRMGDEREKLGCLSQKVQPQKFKKILDPFLPNRVSYLPIITQ